MLQSTVATELSSCSSEDLWLLDSLRCSSSDLSADGAVLELQKDLEDRFCGSDGLVEHPFCQEIRDVKSITDSKQEGTINNHLLQQIWKL